MRHPFVDKIMEENMEDQVKNCGNKCLLIKGKRRLSRKEDDG